MSVSKRAVRRSTTVAVLTAAAVAIGASTAGADAPAAAQPTPAPAAQQIISSQVDQAAHTATLTLASGTFAMDPAAQAIDVRNVDGQSVGSIPLTVHDSAVPVAGTVSDDGHALTLRQVAFTDTANALVNQWVWGVQNGGAVGAIIGCLLGAWLFVIPGCIVGAAIGGAIGSPNSGEINATFYNLITGR
ncbi:hypothetical protein BJY24_001635 [Nocardia transvalensis]|uniref:DUF8020 domain-containing protein n=1 Tax=Nocardia transvalensis TaxID=37333 RepID=A0A7W9UGX7_9NOCA|nr:hypothetical protein [Nocardia transvalensis]MBB5912768.1 hypothetical protein [Nocardia transvalensis]